MVIALQFWPRLEEILHSETKIADLFAVKGASTVGLGKDEGDVKMATDVSMFFKCFHIGNQGAVNQYSYRVYAGVAAAASVNFSGAKAFSVVVAAYRSERSQMFKLLV